jgi:hypothetical protein
VPSVVAVGRGRRYRLVSFGVLIACDSPTRSCTELVVVNAGNVPDWPPPVQLTSHDTVADATNMAPGSPALLRAYVCPQSGDGAAGLPPAVYGVPGPLHTTVDPSPNDQVTDIGEAVAVTDSPGTDAVALTGVHAPWSSHNHVATFTSCMRSGGGDVTTRGPGNENWFTAWRASTSGAGNGAALPAGTHTIPPAVPANVPLVQLTRYQAPASPACCSTDAGG